MAALTALSPSAAQTAVRPAPTIKSSGASTPARETVIGPATGVNAPREQSGASPDTGGLLADLTESVVRNRQPRSTALDDAIAAASELIRAQNLDDAKWVHAARALRAAAVERQRSSPRAASVALLLSDALGFTDPATLAAADRVPLRIGCETLMQPFVSTDDERRVFASLLEHRWYVTAAFDGDGFAAAAGAV